MRARFSRLWFAEVTVARHFAYSNEPKDYGTCPACGSNATESEAEVKVIYTDGAVPQLLELWGCDCCTARWYEHLAYHGFERVADEAH